MKLFKLFLIAVLISKNLYASEAKIKVQLHLLFSENKYVDYKDKYSNKNYNNIGIGGKFAAPFSDGDIFDFYAGLDINIRHLESGHNIINSNSDIYTEGVGLLGVTIFDDLFFHGGYGVTNIGEESELSSMYSLNLDYVHKAYGIGVYYTRYTWVEVEDADYLHKYKKDIAMDNIGIRVFYEFK